MVDASHPCSAHMLAVNKNTTDIVEIPVKAPEDYLHN
jgi:hypothetical protein